MSSSTESSVMHEDKQEVRKQPAVYFDYLAACSRHQQVPDPWVAIGFYVCSSQLRVTRGAKELVIIPIAELYLSKRLAFIESIHFSGLRLSHVGALLIAEIIRSPSSNLKELNLSSNRLGGEGVSIIASALAENDNLEVLDLSRNKIGRAGAMGLASLLDNGGASALKKLDVFGNLMGIKGIERLTRSCEKRGILLLDEGNHVLSETLNGFTHALGLFVSVFAGGALITEARELFDDGYITLPLCISIYVFVFALCSTFGSSALYHSAFRFRGPFRHVLKVLDHCSIFLLIAGTYTPFLFKFIWSPSVYGPRRSIMGPVLFTLVWIFAAAGILLSSGVMQRTPSAKLRASLALGMGWLVMLSIRVLWLHMSKICLSVIALGGLFYTAGVPFYLGGLRKPMLHVYWHCCVMLGALAHYVAILFYVLRYPTPP